MRKLLLGATLIVGTLALAAPAAARAPISATDAYPAAKTAVDQNYAQAFAPDAVDAMGEPITDEGDPYVSGYTLYPCDTDTSYRSLCDVTVTWSDGSYCNDTLEVVATNGDPLVNSLTNWGWPVEHCFGSAQIARTRLHRRHSARAKYVVRCKHHVCRGMRHH